MSDKIQAPKAPVPIQQQPVSSEQSQKDTKAVVVGQTNVTPAQTYESYLKDASLFSVTQLVDLLEVIIGWEEANRYLVKDQTGKLVFYVGERSGCCSRQCLGSCRPFTMLVKDTNGQDILIMEREFKCDCFCGAFCPDSMSILTPTGQLLGTITGEFSILYPRFLLRNAAGLAQLRIQGPLCPFSCCGGSVEFRILDLAGVQVGFITKLWSGFTREFFTDADSFSASFPADLDPAMKAVCLGALFLIDFEFFEHGGRH